MSDETGPDQARAVRLKRLWALRSRDSDVRLILDRVLAKENTDIFTLAEEQPEVFDELAESCFDMVAELPEDSGE